MRLPVGRFPIGIKGILFIVILSFLFGLNPLQVLSVLSGYSPTLNSSSPSQVSQIQSDEPEVKFVRSILGSTEDVWSRYFQQHGSTYSEPQLAIFNQYTRSSCGFASDAMGPFYCSLDHRVYLDLNFFNELESKFQASGDFAKAYVIAHEVGHHVQNILGTMDKVQNAADSGLPMKGAKGLSVRLELQADCLAGVWANHSQQQLNWLQEGDIDEALNAASRIGDDLLETEKQGYAVPDSFTHGTSAQRVQWFKTGFTSGNVSQCDTFGRNLG